MSKDAVKASCAAATSVQLRLALSETVAGMSSWRTPIKLHKTGALPMPMANQTASTVPVPGGLKDDEDVHMSTENEAKEPCTAERSSNVSPCHGSQCMRHICTAYGAHAMQVQHSDPNALQLRCYLHEFVF